MKMKFSTRRHLYVYRHAGILGFALLLLGIGWVLFATAILIGEIIYHTAQPAVRLIRRLAHEATRGGTLSLFLLGASLLVASTALGVIGWWLFHLARTSI